MCLTERVHLPTYSIARYPLRMRMVEVQNNEYLATGGDPKKIKKLKRRGVPTHIVEEQAVLDLHAWCENSAGDVIFDPMFPEYERDKRINGCVGDPLYQELDDNGEMLKVIQDKILDPWVIENVQLSRMKYKDLKNDKGGPATDHEIIHEALFPLIEEQPHHLGCFLNAWAYYQNHIKKGEDVHYKYGKWGWRRKAVAKGPSGIHWEFG